MAINERSNPVDSLPARGRGGVSHPMRFAAAAGWLCEASHGPRSGPQRRRTNSHFPCFIIRGIASPLHESYVGRIILRPGSGWVLSSPFHPSRLFHSHPSPPRDTLLPAPRSSILGHSGFLSQHWKIAQPTAAESLQSDAHGKVAKTVPAQCPPNGCTSLDNKGSLVPA